MTDVKLCADCKWCVPEVGLTVIDRWAQCTHATAIIQSPPDVVTGNPPTYRHQLCRYHRLAGAECGPEGKYWEAAERRGFA